MYILTVSRREKETWVQLRCNSCQEDVWTAASETQEIAVDIAILNEFAREHYRKKCR